jgi:hypothetical protein
MRNGRLQVVALRKVAFFPKEPLDAHSHGFSAQRSCRHPVHPCRAPGDSLLALAGVTPWSAKGMAIDTGAFNNHAIAVPGTLFSTNPVTLNANASFGLGIGARCPGFGAGAGSGALFLSGAGSTAQIEGSPNTPGTIGILSQFGSKGVTVAGTGTISGAAGGSTGSGAAAWTPIP